MNRRATLVFILIFLAASCTIVIHQPVKADSQAPEIIWSKNYNGFNGWKTIQTSDGGFAIAEDTLDHVTMAIKVDADGNRQWEKTYPTNGSSGARSIVQSTDGGYMLLTGGWLLKLDSDGNMQWSKNFSFYANDIIQTMNGSYVLVGSLSHASRNYAMLVKVDEEGNLLWSKEFYNYTISQDLQLTSECTANSVIETKTGNYAFTGTWAWGSAWLCEVDPEGNIILNETYPSGFSYSYGISQTKDGGFILAGNGRDQRSTGTNGYVLRTDSQGKTVWLKSFTIDSYSFRSAVQTSDEGFLAAGAYSTGANDYNIVIHLSASGDVQWKVTFEASQSTDTAYSVMVTKNGDCVVGGQLNGGSWLAKLTPKSSPTPSPEPQSNQAPELQWNRTYPRRADYNFVNDPIVRENRYPIPLDKGRFIIQTVDGSFVLAGVLDNHDSVPHSGGIDEYSGGLVKADSAGTLQWGMNTSLFTYPTWMLPTSDSGFVVVADQGYQLIKYNSEGSLMWNKPFTNTRLIRAIQTEDGGYMLTGSSPNGSNEDKGIILKTDPNGNLLWNRTLDNGSLYCVAATDSGFALAGGLANLVWFVSTDKDGNLLLNQTYMQGYASSITKTRDGSYIVSGSDESSYNNAKGLILKLNSTGSLQWSFRVSQPQYSSFSILSVIQSVDGRYIVLGDSALFKMDDLGNVIWVAQSVGSRSSDLVLTDAKGNQVSSKSFDGVLNGYLVNGAPYSITATRDGGFALGGTQDDWFWVAKFAPEAVPVNPTSSPNPSIEPSSSPTPSTSSTPSPIVPESLLWAIILALLVVTAILAVALKRKRGTVLI